MPPMYIASLKRFMRHCLQVYTVDEINRIKVAEDDIAFKLAIFKKKSLHLNDNTGFCSIIQASKLVFGSLLAKNNFFVQF